ncbi:HAD-like protein [Ramicandelaber brevisporus]|nr:HAD-like protein [Ramicandelaber brevisporus]
MGDIIKAVFFDIGGVVMRSPFITIASYEKKLGLPPHYINVAIAAHGAEHGAFQRLETGRYSSYADFFADFTRQLNNVEFNKQAYRKYVERNRKAGGQTSSHVVEGNLPYIDGRRLFLDMMKQASAFDEHIVAAIRKLRASGKFKVIAVSNNYPAAVDIAGNPARATQLRTAGQAVADASGDAELLSLMTDSNFTAANLFDSFVGSAETGLRKPDRAIFELACKRVNVEPAQAAFLDDIELNVRGAQKLGIRAIHVKIGHTKDAVRQLQEIVGIPLLDDSSKL